MTHLSLASAGSRGKKRATAAASAPAPPLPGCSSLSAVEARSTSGRAEATRTTLCMAARMRNVKSSTHGVCGLIVAV